MIWRNGSKSACGAPDAVLTGWSPRRAQDKKSSSADFVCAGAWVAASAAARADDDNGPTGTHRDYLRSRSGVDERAQSNACEKCPPTATNKVETMLDAERNRVFESWIDAHKAILLKVARVYRHPFGSRGSVPGNRAAGVAQR